MFLSIHVVFSPALFLSFHLHWINPPFLRFLSFIHCTTATFLFSVFLFSTMSGVIYSSTARLLLLSLSLLFLFTPCISSLVSYRQLSFPLLIFLTVSCSPLINVIGFFLSFASSLFFSFIPSFLLSLARNKNSSSGPCAGTFRDGYGSFSSLVS